MNTSRSQRGRLIRAYWSDVFVGLASEAVIIANLSQPQGTLMIYLVPLPAWPAREVSNKLGVTMCQSADPMRRQRRGVNRSGIDSCVGAMDQVLDRHSHCSGHRWSVYVLFRNLV